MDLGPVILSRLFNCSGPDEEGCRGREDEEEEVEVVVVELTVEDVEEEDNRPASGPNRARIVVILSAIPKNSSIL